MIVAGIDPGISGAIAVVDHDGNCETVDMLCIVDQRGSEVNPIAVHHFLKSRDAQFVVIEHAQSMPKQGVASTFKYGQAFGTVLACGQLLMVPVTLIKPQLWKRQMGLIGRNKTASRERAIDLFPRSKEQFKMVKDHNKAEAALIAWWWLHHPLRADLARNVGVAA